MSNSPSFQVWANSSNVAEKIEAVNDDVESPVAEKRPSSRAPRFASRGRAPVSYKTMNQELEPRFRHTTFPSILSNADTCRTTSSFYLMHQKQEILKHLLDDSPGNDAQMQRAVGKDEKDPFETIVLHIGSQTLKIGRPYDLKPVCIPTVLARRFPVEPDEKAVCDQQGDADEQDRMDAEFHAFMKASNLRVPMNAYTVAQGFNAASAKKRTEMRPVNDPNHIDWLKIDPSLSESPKIFFGEEALNLDTLRIEADASKSYKFKLLWPFEKRTWNTRQYSNVMYWRNDVAQLLDYALSVHLKVPKDASNLRIALVVPDLFDPNCVEELVNLLFDEVGISAVALFQESLMACCGAGLSLACVVDVGATLTSVTTIENGDLTCNAVALYGGDNVSREFYRRLSANSFPIRLNLETAWDWRLLEGLKEKHATANENELAVNLFEIVHRSPTEATHSYQFKVYNEVYMAPLSLFYPAVYGLGDLLGTIGPLRGSMSRYGWKPLCDGDFGLINCPIDRVIAAYRYWNTRQTRVNVQSFIDPDGFEFVYDTGFESETEIDDPDVNVAVAAAIPLDVLVAHVLCRAADGSEERLRRLASSILLVGGGGGPIRGFAARMLEPRIRMVLPNAIAAFGIALRSPNPVLVSVAPPPREMDHRFVVWKGGSVASRLECTSHAWITRGEWRALGFDACVSYKSYLAVLEETYSSSK